MPRNFPNLNDDVDLPDREGAELTDLAATRERATVNALDLMCGFLRAERRITLHHRH